jgi:microcystin-dependent protein
MRARAVHPKGGKPKPPALPTTAFRSFIAFLSISSSSSGAHNHTGTTSLEQIGDQNVIGNIHAVTGIRSNARNEADSATTWAAVTSINPEAINTNHSHTFTTSSDGFHSHDITMGDTGDGQAHENRPPYYALAYIMKL